MSPTRASFSPFLSPAGSSPFFPLPSARLPQISKPLSATAISLPLTTCAYDLPSLNFGRYCEYLGEDILVDILDPPRTSLLTLSLAQTTCKVVPKLNDPPKLLITTSASFFDLNWKKPYLIPPPTSALLGTKQSLAFVTLSNFPTNPRAHSQDPIFPTKTDANSLLRSMLSQIANPSIFPYSSIANLPLSDSSETFCLLQHRHQCRNQLQLGLKIM